MAPAFPSTRRAAAFGATLLFLLTLPITLHWIGRVPIEEAYRGISERAGTFDYMRRQMFDNHSPVDIMFCGGSLLGNAVDVHYVERELSKALGRPASVILLRQSWQGPDMNYFVARDFLEHRKARLFVIAAPAWVHHASQPHVQLLRVIRYGDHPGATDGLSLRGRVGLYADYVLGAPRQALNLLRPNMIYPQGEEPASPHEHPAGYMGCPFVRRPVAIPDFPPSSMIFSGETRELFRFDGPPLNAYQFHFLRKTVELAQQQNTPIVILHLPSPSERGVAVVPERQPVAELLGAGVDF